MGSKKSKAAKNPYGVPGAVPQQNGQFYPGGSYYQQPQYFAQPQYQPVIYQSPSLVLPPPPPPQVMPLPPPVAPLPPIVGPLPPAQYPPMHVHHHRRHRGPRVIDEPPIPLNAFH